MKINSLKLSEPKPGRNGVGSHCGPSGFRPIRTDIPLDAIGLLQGRRNPRQACSVSPRASLSPRDIGISNPLGPRREQAGFSARPKSSSGRYVENGDLYHQCRRHGFHQITDATQTNFNQTGPGRQKHSHLEPKEPKRRGIPRHGGRRSEKTGEEMALTNKGTHTWAYTCLTDGRILVNHAHPKQGRVTSS